MNVKSLIAVLFISAGTFLGAEDVNIRITPQPVIAGEPARLTVYSSKGYPLINTLPEVKGLSWRPGTSRNMRTTIINGQRTMTAQTVYTFTVNSSGTYTIPPLTVETAGVKGRSAPVVFKALERQFRVAGSEENKKGEVAALDELIFIKPAILSEQTDFYVGEEIPLEIRIYIYRGLKVQLSWPKITTENVVFRDYSGINKENEHFVPPRQLTENIKGNIYDVYAFRTAFRAIASGKLKLNISEECQINVPRERRRRSSFFDNDDFFSLMDPFDRYKKITKHLSSDIKGINIKELPMPPQNTEFLGLVGNWYMSANLKKGRYKTGEPLTLTIKIRGTGSMETLEAPELKIEGFRVYPPEVDKSAPESGAVREAEINYVLIPLNKGYSNVRLSVSVFSTAESKYKIFEFEKKIKVEKGDSSDTLSQIYVDSSKGGEKTDVAPRKIKKRRRSGILYLKKKENHVVKLPLWRNNLLLLLLIIVAGPLVFILSEAFRRRRMKLSRDPLLRRKKAALASKSKIIAKVNKCPSSKLDSLIQSEVVSYINDIMGLPPGTNASELSSKVKNRELAEVLDSVQGSSYMPGNTETDTNEIKKKICRVLKKSVFLFIFAFFPLYSGAAQKDMPLLKNSREALNAYDRGEFKKTAEYYKSRINPSAPSPALVYNLGNCYCQEGDYAKALVCYERALRLAPNDSDIFENLNFVRRKLFLPEITAPRNPAELLVSIRRHLRPDQWILIAGAFWMICWFTLIFRRKLSGGKLILLLSAGFIGMVLCITTAASQYASTYSAENAIITERGVKVYSLPSENSETTGVKLKNGEQVKIVEQRLDWARIRDGQAEGWIHSEELARIWGEFKAFRGEKKKYK